MIHAIDGYYTSLTLMLRGTRGALPIKLSLHTKHDERPRSDMPSRVGMDFDLSMFAGQLELKQPQVVLRMKEGESAPVIVEADVDERARSICGLGDQCAL